jgi:hypothetical protein
MLYLNHHSYLRIVNSQFKKSLKFAEEGRFSFGVCVRLNKEGVEEGVRLPVFDYTCKMIYGIKRYEMVIRQEIIRVKSLTIPDRVSQKWAGCENRPAGSIWLCDDVEELKGIGPAKGIKLREAGMKTIQNIKDLNDASMQRVSSISGIGKNLLLTLRAEAETATAGVSPYPIAFDYVEGAENPYEKRYGDNWREEIKKVSRSGLTRIVCVTELIEHIDTHTKNAYKGTPFADNYYWAHDALSQMCDDDAIAWMKQKGYYKRWIKPELGLNDHISFFDEETQCELSSKRYKNRPVGNQPELMPLDASLNRDIDCSFDMHVLLTAHLEKDDPRKFQKNTPKNISKAILKLYDPVSGVVPKSKRIIEDCWRVVSSLQTIVKAGGKIVPSLVNRNGHRNKNNSGRKYYPRKVDQVIANMDEMGIFKETQRVAIEENLKEAINFELKTNLDN